MRALFLCAVLGTALAFPTAERVNVQKGGALPETGEPQQPDVKLKAAEGLDAQAPAAPVDSTSDDPADRLDALFAQLKRERSPEAAEAIAGQIQAAWLESGSATVDLLMLWAATASATSDAGVAFDLLEQAMVLKPDYAEAYNARATANFLLSRYGRSLADIEQTLIREPRHFGALMGLGAILEQLDRKDGAMDAYRRALAVYPAMREAQEALGRLADETSGQSL
ncbi:tetratricopeptide repeat protein [Aureimonas mangrovi]|uniref:tetratricopeptide repeat protein n=1 Tax=Aureimonas mangrovi TaxID=2758041 RepID=UPI00163DA30E|nr:tetratricopeptide repeat protein [Aureimonas mangrovi]